ncbi:hypothetical protein [Pseudoruegeria sp. SK021]|uniref:hypothetical protein n=1 Tax=Pseudoruegeria sp. SK021 TaxID=1933035 RepID=UPI00143DDF95|nr:hypothetical protein [Pseudoruegeria sp. SK021]
MHPNLMNLDRASTDRRQAATVKPAAAKPQSRRGWALLTSLTMAAANQSRT